MPPWIYIGDDGVEYVNATKRNDTLKVVLQQQFFTELQLNLLNQALALIGKNALIGPDGKKLGPINVADLFTVEAEISNLFIKNFSLDNTHKLMQLGDNQAVFSIADLVGHVEFDYSYLTDPPLLADIGTFHFDLAKTNLTVDASTNMEPSSGVMQIELHEFNLSMDEFKLNIDGVSDLGLVLNDLVNYVGNVLQYRLLNIVKFLGADKIGNLVNVLLE